MFSAFLLKSIVYMLYKCVKCFCYFMSRNDKTLVFFQHVISKHTNNTCLYNISAHKRYSTNMFAIVRFEKHKQDIVCEISVHKHETTDVFQGFVPTRLTHKCFLNILFRAVPHLDRATKVCGHLVNLWSICCQYLVKFGQRCFQKCVDIWSIFV